jgi:hypothetical protein
MKDRPAIIPEDGVIGHSLVEFDDSMKVAHPPHRHRSDYRAYEALDPEGHRWRFVQWLNEVPQ